MRKKNKLYTVNKFNRPAFMPADVDRVHQNIFDGYTESQISKGNLSSDGFKKFSNTATGILGSVGPELIGGLVNNTKYGRKKTVGGQALTTVGAGLLSKGQWWGAIPMALGIAADNLFGVTYNEEGIRDIKERNTQMRAKGNALSQSSSTDDLINKWKDIDLGYSFDKGFIGEEGALSDELGWEHKKLENQRDSSLGYVAHGLQTGVDNVNKTQRSFANANFVYANGGPLFLDNNDNMGAINYDFMTDYLIAKNKKADNNSQMTNLFAGTPSTMFAIGGDLQTNSADYSVGKVYDVSKEEANRLKAMGYEFTVIG